jgi:hypothetical protein
MVRMVNKCLTVMLLAAAVMAACQNKSSGGKNQSGAGGEGGTGGDTGGGTAGVFPSAGSSTTGDGTCDSPIILSGSRNLKDQTTVELLDQINAQDPSCLGVTTSGPERVYKVIVPSSSRNQLRVTVTPDTKPKPDALDVVVFLTESCNAQPLCLAAKDSRGGGSPEVLTFLNETSESKELFLIVDGFGFQPNGGGYQMKVELVDP